MADGKPIKQDQNDPQPIDEQPSNTKPRLAKIVEQLNEIVTIGKPLFSSLPPFLLFVAPILCLFLFPDVVPEVVELLPEDYNVIRDPKEPTTYWGLSVFVAVAVGLLLVWIWRRPLPSLLFVAPTLFVLVFFDLIPKDSNEPPAKAVVDTLQGVVTDWRFLVSASLLIGVWMVRIWYMHDKLQKEFESKNCDKGYRGALTRRNWWATYEIRKRALALRLRADLILGCVFVLLLGGSYLIIFGLPHIQEIDAFILWQAEQQAIFREKYGTRLQATAEGRYWLQIAESHSRPFEVASRRLSVDGNHGAFMGSMGSSFVTEDGGLNWSVENLELKPGERSGVTGFTKNGDLGVFAGNMGSFFETTDGGLTWSQKEDLKLKSEEELVRLSFGEGGKRAVLVGSLGSIFVRPSIGTTQTQKTELQLRSAAERLNRVWFKEDGKRGLLVGTQGSVFMTKDGGKEWSRAYLELTLDDRLGELLEELEEFLPLNELLELFFDRRFQGGAWYHAWISTDGMSGVLIDPLALVLVTTDGGENWTRMQQDKLKLKPGELLFKGWSSEDDNRGAFVGSRGSVFVTTDSGGSWTQEGDLKLKSEERLTRVWSSEDGNRGVLVGSRGSVFATMDRGESWNQKEDLRLKSEEMVNTAWFSENGSLGVLLSSHRGSVFVTTDGGGSWARTDLELKPGERLNMVWINEDGSLGVLAGNEGSVFTTTQDGDWNTTAKHDGDRPFVDIIFIGDLTVAVNDHGSLCVLKDHAEMRGWRTWPLSEILDKVKDNEAFTKSRLFEDIETFVSRADGNGRGARGSDEPSVNPPKSLLEHILDGFDDLTVMRAVTLVVLFFLVRVLIQLYQYNLRLAAFWESRSDAILLADRFAETKARTFDDLVGTLAPDAYDFNPVLRPRLRFSVGGSRQGREP